MNRDRAIQVLTDAEVVVVVAGDKVPSVHLHAENATADELVRAMACVRGRRVLLGPLATYEVKGRRLFELDRQRLARLNGMLAVLHWPSLDDGVCREIGFAAALGVPIVVLTTDFQSYGPSEHGAELHFPNALVQAVVTEIVRADRLASPGEAETRLEAFQNRNLCQLSNGVNLAVDRLVAHTRPPSERKPTAGPGARALAVCERSPHHADAAWDTITHLLASRGYPLHQSQSFGAENPLATACNDWKELLGCQLLVYGPLRHGGSRLAGADARDLAVAVARRDGVLVHLTGPTSVIRARLLIRDGAAADLADIDALRVAYERVVSALAPYLPIVTVDTQ